MKAIIYFDGACLPQNPNGVGTYGFVIKNAYNGAIMFSGKGVSFEKGTNNMAEYWALIHALEKAIELNLREIEIYGDSTLVINQIKGINNPADKALISLNQKAKKLLGKFDSWNIKWLNREKNKEADMLSLEAFIEFIENKNRETIEELIRYDLIKEGNSIYRLKNYLVNLNPPSCTCQYFKKYNNLPLIRKAKITVKCKHILYVEERLKIENQDKLIKKNTA